MSTILYVDDDPDDREIFLEACKMAYPGIKCKIATDGFDAIQKLQQLGKENLPGCIYIDINMPKLNGIELLRRLKADAIYGTIPVFIMSTSLSADHRKEARQLGAVDCLIKPNSFEGMRDLLRNCIDLHVLLASSSLRSR